VALACFHLLGGEIDQAAEWTGKALDDGYSMSTNMFIGPFERLLRQSRAWPGLMKKLNLPGSTVSVALSPAKTEFSNR
jgi:hypothetical protein